MKLCVLKNKIDENYLYTDEGLYLYYLPIDEYKKHILKGVVYTDDGRFSGLCYWYALEVLKGKFTIGEDAISMNGLYSYWYARDIIRGRFILGEESISRTVSHSFYYADSALLGRFVLGEKVISTDAWYSYMYASTVLRNRFKLGEKMIKQSEYRQDYENHFNIKL